MKSTKKGWLILLCVFCLLFVATVIGIRFVAQGKINQYSHQSIYTTPLPEQEY